MYHFDLMWMSPIHDVPYGYHNRLSSNPNPVLKKFVLNTYWWRTPIRSGFLICTKNGVCELSLEQWNEQWTTSFVSAIYLITIPSYFYSQLNIIKLSKELPHSAIMNKVFLWKPHFYVTEIAQSWCKNLQSLYVIKQHVSRRKK